LSSNAIYDFVSTTHQCKEVITMNVTTAKKASMIVLSALLAAALPQGGHTSTAITNETSLITVAVNGGADTLNPGTSCIQLAEPPAGCPAGFLYIPNNNKHLVAAAIAAKASSNRVTVYYVAAAAAGHCPGYVFTPCSVISINQK
jgi:hypothetical protein